MRFVNGSYLIAVPMVINKVYSFRSDWLGLTSHSATVYVVTNCHLLQNL